jgi:hypothetical protein
MVSASSTIRIPAGQDNMKHLRLGLEASATLTASSTASSSP